MDLLFFAVFIGTWIISSAQPTSIDNCTTKPEVFSLCATYDTKWDGVRTYMYPRKDVDRLQSFENGQVFCAKHGASLISVHSIAETFVLYNLTSWINNPKRIWLGLRRNRRKEVPRLNWEWVDGSLVDFTMWHTSYPQYRGSDCATLDISSHWYNYDYCSSRQHIICQETIRN